MAKIYLIRHAESVANTAGIYQGQSYDTDLSPLGRLQTQALKNRFKSEKPDAVFTSPLKRTRQTAAALGGSTDEPALFETNHGQWEGKSKAQIKATWPDLYQKWQTHPSLATFPGGESFADTATRTINWFDNLANQPGTFAAVTHANIIQVILCYLLKLDLDKIWHLAMQPTAVTLMETHSPAKIIYLNDTSHLKGLESDLAKQAIWSTSGLFVNNQT